MYKKLICLCLSLTCWTAQAHQPQLSSTLLAERGENQWVIQIRAALTAFEYEVEQHFGKDAYASPEAFQELVIQDVREHLTVQFNDNLPVSLENPIVKLGHETTLAFQIIGTPKEIQTLTVQNQSFDNISRNQSALIVVKENFAKQQFVLNQQNKHRVELKVEQSRFELVSSNQNSSPFALIILSIIFSAILGLMWFRYQKRQGLKAIPEFS